MYKFLEKVLICSMGVIWFNLDQSFYRVLVQIEVSAFIGKQASFKEAIQEALISWCVSVQSLVVYVFV